MNLKLLKKKRHGHYNFEVTKGQGDLSASQQCSRAKKAILQCVIFTTRVTHGGRHAGAIEAESLDMPLDVIKRGGGWMDRLGRLETHYLGKLPSQFAKGIAGFWEKSFYLARNSVNPPLDLQRKIFPWIESLFGENNREWKRTCDSEMTEKDENEESDSWTDEENDVSVNGDSDDSSSDSNGEEIDDGFNFEFIQGDGQAESSQSKKQKKKQRDTTTTAPPLQDKAKIGFLRLLLRFRRIILQDAAVYIHYKKENWLINSRNTPFDSNNDLFVSPAFKSFQQDVVAAILTAPNDRVQQYEHVIPEIASSHREMAAQLTGVQSRLDRGERSMQSLQEGLQRLETSLHLSRNEDQQTQANLHQDIQRILRQQDLIIENQFHLNLQYQLFLAARSNSNAANNMNVPGSIVQQPIPVNFSTSSSNASNVNRRIAPSPIPSAPSPVPIVHSPAPLPSSPLTNGHTSNVSSHSTPAQRASSTRPVNTTGSKRRRMQWTNIDHSSFKK